MFFLIKFLKSCKVLKYNKIFLISTYVFFHFYYHIDRIYTLTFMIFVYTSYFLSPKTEIGSILAFQNTPH